MYSVSLEIAGPAAMFTRPDTGSTPISYPVPTFSAAKGMFEAVARKPRAFIRPTRVEVCKPVRYERYVTNYGGPQRKPGQVKGNNNYQLIATILVDVCFRIWGTVELAESSNGSVNQAHALQEIFVRRLQAGQSFYVPCLGWKEFVPSYFGPLREGSRPDKEVNLVIPSMLHSVFDRPTAGKVAPTFRQDVKIRAGEMSYEDRRSC